MRARALRACSARGSRVSEHVNAVPPRLCPHGAATAKKSATIVFAGVKGVWSVDACNEKCKIGGWKSTAYLESK